MAKRASERMEHPKVIEPQKGSNEGAIRLLNEWMADESGYDEKVWPVLKQAIEKNRLSRRKRFRG